uniref:spermidine synthase n=1 Tax=Tetraselmis chuii TaxID=63592 RepID=A0A7S1SKC8_9CHLO|mmetsp:Transcript_16830/g.29998  ORF Transcript_16830/g.29998 Transcript_16830/m.29998 type:complete len:343 (+) Transcript_16830:166-1194(+)|eukprot:CAMPEP_0177764708 /NCGR_PEP_ID=MMETSP0491_2-20121128/7558_1 /TAXON_ID=63592 /ORGANISM="Tetraselmis chuii, Strain PLY429" /LENGTH=342 /DNA_ID=CAMNT_0019280919 /DNA_START=99 /DNA_END=1127 /DNA_ORIENTATION=-
MDRFDQLTANGKVAALAGVGAGVALGAYLLGRRSGGAGLVTSSGRLVAGGWFTELGTLWPGQGLSIQIKKVLLKTRTKFQDLAVFESDAFGTVLTLDGVVQVTDRDEFSYQEMITHLPLCGISRAPKRVLVVGGGDGGVVREITRHAGVEKIDMAEIDAGVCEASKKFFPQLACGFADPRLNLMICDGIDYLRKAAEGTYDAIIVDSSDPVGPAEVLFQRPFFELMHRALKPGGAICTQGESLWLHMPIIEEVAKMCKDIFKGGTVNYAYTTIPTYPSGQIGFMICTKKDDKKASMKVPQRAPPGPGPMNLPPLRYYSAEVHKASFVLPQYATSALAGYLSH